MNTYQESLSTILGSTLWAVAIYLAVIGAWHLPSIGIHWPLLIFAILGGILTEVGNNVEIKISYRFKTSNSSTKES